MRLPANDTQIAELGTEAVSPGREGREHIVGTPVLSLDGCDPRLLDENARNDHSAIAQQSHCVEGHRQPLSRGQGRVLCETLWIGDLYPVRHRHSLSAKPKREMLQRNWTPECGGGLVGDQRADPVPVPHRQQHADSDQHTTHHVTPEPPALMAPALGDQVSLHLLNVAVNAAGGAATRAAVLGVGHNPQSRIFLRGSL